MRPKWLALPLILTTGFLFIAPSRAYATPFVPPTLTFNDLTDAVTVTVSPGEASRVSNVTCDAEVCSLFLLAPAAGLVMASPEFFARIGESDFTSGLISDVLVASTRSGPVATVSFLSDSEGNLGSCSALNPCQLVEDGSVQLGLLINWVDPHNPTVVVAADRVAFQSDVDATAPEPTTLLLLGTGLAVTAFRHRRQRG